MHALDWLGDIAQWILTLVPRLVLVRKTHAGVKFTRGRAIVLKPGLHLVWPVWSEVEKVCVVRQTVNLPYQCLVASDGTGVVVAVTVVYTISDAMAALTGTDNLVDTVLDISHLAVKRVVQTCLTGELRDGSIKRNGRSYNLDKLLRKRLSLDLSTYGVSVKQAFISEIAFPLMVRMIGADYAPN